MAMERNLSPTGRAVRHGARHRARNGTHHPALNGTHPRVLNALLACLTGLVLALPGAARAQDPAGTQDPAPLREGPLEWLLAARAELELTDEQTARLEEVRLRLHTRNEPLIRRLMVLRTEWQRERMLLRRSGAARESPRLQQIRTRSDVLYLQIQRHNRAAMAEVNRVLTPPQRQRVRALLEERRGRGGPGAPMRMPGAEPGG
jgi:Spy/CpxP family protein refolding chaperone